MEIIQKGRLAGLGFSTVREIVSESGGVVTVDSVPGRGTRVTVYLPVAVGDVVVATPAQRARIRRSGTETVLLIEDDVAVRDRVRRLLEGSGYRVLEAPDGEHALDLVAREGEPIDLLVTDVGLPGMDGLGVAHRLKEMSPNMRALIISGYSKERILQRWILDGQADILSKPFTQEELLSLTRAMLDNA